MNGAWTYLPFEEAVDICDSLRKPINNKERSQRVEGKRPEELYPYYGATGQVGVIDGYITDGEYVLLGEDGAPFLNPLASKAYIITGKTWVNNHAHVLKSKFNNRFLCYYLNSINYKGYVSGTTRLKLTQRAMKQISIPVPSVQDQERIVALIEELFSQLDTGIETLKRTQRKLDIYRQAVLKAVFANVNQKKPVRELSEFVTSGSRGWAKYYADYGARFVRITDLTRDSIYLKNDNIQYVLLPENAEGKRSRLQGNDVLVSITADLGSIAWIPENIEEAYINQHIAMIRFKHPKQGELMAWYLKSDYGQNDLLKNKRGGGKLGLGLDDIRDTPVPVLTDFEAEQMLNEIESRLSVCYEIERTVEYTIQEAEAIRRSILKKAFEGRL